MVSQLLKRMGQRFREERKKRGIRQKDLVDHDISVATISYFETGKQKIGKQKVFLLLQKLNLNYDELLTCIQNEETVQEENMETYLQLCKIEQEIDHHEYGKALIALKRFDCSADAKTQINTSYLKGKYYLHRGKWKKAEMYYEKAIRLCDQLYPRGKHTNIKSASFYHLSMIYFFRDECNQAMHLAKKGEDAFVIKGERTSCKYALKASQIIYLERLGRVEEAIEQLEQIWISLDKIKKSDIRLLLYGLKSSFLIKQKRYNQAIQLIEEAIQLAREEENDDRSCELWMLLANAYSNKKEIHLAKLCLQTSVDLKTKTKKLLISTTYERVCGEMYVKLEEYDLARDSLEKVIKRDRKILHEQQLCFALLLLGNCYLEQGDKKNGLQSYLDAHHLSREYKIADLDKEISLKLAQYYEREDQTLHQKYLTFYYQNSVREKDNCLVKTDSIDFIPQLGILEEKTPYQT